MREVSEKLKRAVQFSDMESGYVLSKTDDGSFIEERNGETKFVTVWALLKATFQEDPGFYQSLRNWMPYLQNLQQNSVSIVDSLITTCKGYDANQLADWFSKRNEAELEELANFGSTVASFANSELSEEGIEEEYDEED